MKSRNYILSTTLGIALSLSAQNTSLAERKSDGVPVEPPRHHKPIIHDSSMVIPRGVGEDLEELSLANDLGYNSSTSLSPSPVLLKAQKPASRDRLERPTVFY